MYHIESVDLESVSSWRVNWLTSGRIYWGRNADCCYPWCATKAQLIDLQQCPDHEEEWLTSFSRKILGAVYTHCYGHVLNLACGETTKKSKVMRDALDTDCQKSPHCDARLHVRLSKKCQKIPLVSECSAQQDGLVELMLCRALLPIMSFCRSCG